MRGAAIARRIERAAIVLFAFGLFPGIVHPNETGPFASSAGVPAGGDFPAEVTCSSSGCHETFPLNPDTRGKIAIVNLPDNYVPGRRYSLTFRITHPDPDRQRWGFQVTAVAKDTFLRAGEFVVTERRNTQIIGGGFGNRQYVEHTAPGTAVGRLGGNSWNFDWIAPSTN
ncbi:MAG: choice-of-anchor V domain-containing protein, partial [bacterium]